jgi:hypothetical protein
MTLTPTPRRVARRPPARPGEKDAKLAQKLGQLQPSSCVSTVMYGPICIFRANLTPVSLAGPAYVRLPAAAGLRRGPLGGVRRRVGRREAPRPREAGSTHSEHPAIVLSCTIVLLCVLYKDMHSTATMHRLRGGGRTGWRRRTSRCCWRPSTATATARARVGMNPIVTSEKQRLNMIGNLA